MMANAAHFSFCDFTASDIKTAVDLPRISRDNLAVKFLGEFNA